MDGSKESGAGDRSGRRARFRLRPQGRNEYVVVVGSRPVATAHFARYQTGEGMRAEAWVEWPGCEPTELLAAYFADFVREIRRMFSPN